MDKFSFHNSFRISLQHFVASDPQLSALAQFKYVAPLDWWKKINPNSAGLYILSGGRQVGKSTSLKLFMRHLLEQNQAPPGNIFYFPCDQIMDRDELYQIITNFRQQINPSKSFYLFIDEITMVEDWEKTIKGFADEGLFRQGICILTGSDRIMLDQAASALPGRRGPSNEVDFLLMPISFREFCNLVHSHSSPISGQGLLTLFNSYLACGGVLPAINNLLMSGAIQPSTYQTYQNWIVGDFLKRGKRKEFLKEVLRVILTTLGSQITYNDLARKCAHINTDTFIDYLHLLERMDVLLVLGAFDQNTQSAFPKKAKKIIFKDPFILSALQKWVSPSKEIIDESILVENLCIAHFARQYPVFYIKAEGEVDLVYLEKNNFWPVEIKWTKKLRPKDIKQIKKYENSVILGKQFEEILWENIPVKSLIKCLYNI
ncbi:MAG: ATP-binding protein [Pseudomonadota bacterium]